MGANVKRWQSLVILGDTCEGSVKAPGQPGCLLTGTHVRHTASHALVSHPRDIAKGAWMHPGMAGGGRTPTISGWLCQYTLPGVRAPGRARSGPVGPCGAEADTLSAARPRGRHTASYGSWLALAGLVVRQGSCHGGRASRGHAHTLARVRVQGRRQPAMVHRRWTQCTYATTEGRGVRAQGIRSRSERSAHVTPSANAPLGAGGTESAAEGAGTAPNGHAIAESDLPPMCRP